jgi:hypothetical protein
MQLFVHDNISRSEWRWVTVWSGFLILLTFIPYLWAGLGVDDRWHFFGLVTVSQDGASYLSHIRDGYNGLWLIELRYTPQTHDSVALFIFYTLLGHIARIFGFSTLVIYHLARMATSFLMFAALYQLGASIWRRLRPRRLFFLFATFGSGLGWIVLIIDLGVLSPDLYASEAFPIYAAYTTPHYPLTIAMLALMVSHFLEVFRPGFKDTPNVENGGLNILIYSTVLAFVEPSTLTAIGAALIIFMILSGFQDKQMPWNKLRWISMVFLPAFPIMVYYALIFIGNDVISTFNNQFRAVTPSIPELLIGYGIILIIAMPSVWRTLRHFSQDGDQFMLIWLIFNLIALYMPFNVQRSLLVGITIPLAFFAIRSIEDYWLERVQKRYHRQAIFLIFVSILPTNVLAFILPVYGIVEASDQSARLGTLVEAPYVEVYQWLDENGNPGEVVLAAPTISLWIPVETDLRVVYGHPIETVPSETHLKAVEAFFRGEDCLGLLDETKAFRVDYVIWGMREDSLLEKPSTSDLVRQAKCKNELETRAQLQEEFAQGQIILYVLRDLR